MSVSKPVAVGAPVRSKVTLKNGTSKALKKVTIRVRVSGSTTVKPRVKKIRAIRRTSGQEVLTYGVLLDAAGQPSPAAAGLMIAGLLYAPES